jgi:hypothetical protein
MNPCFDYDFNLRLSQYSCRIRSPIDRCYVPAQCHQRKVTKVQAVPNAKMVGKASIRKCVLFPTCASALDVSLRIKMCNAI